MRIVKKFFLQLLVNSACLAVLSICSAHRAAAQSYPTTYICSTGSGAPTNPTYPLSGGTAEFSSFNTGTISPQQNCTYSGFGTGTGCYIISFDYDVVSNVGTTLTDVLVQSTAAGVTYGSVFALGGTGTQTILTMGSTDLSTITVEGIARANSTFGSEADLQVGNITVTLAPNGGCLTPPPPPPPCNH